MLLGWLDKAANTAIGAGISGSIGNHFNKDFADHKHKQNLEILKNQFNNALALQQKQFDQQNYLASNAIQLKMQDMQKAGINPLLASASNAFSSGGGSAPVNHSSKNAGNQPSNGQYPKVVNAKKLYILK